MRDKLIKVGLGITGISSGTIILLSVGAYEQGSISGYTFFWQMTVGILLLLLILISCLYLDLERDYIELSEDFNDYLDVEEAEEIRIPQEVEIPLPEKPFKFTIPEGSDTE